MRDLNLFEIQRISLGKAHATAGDILLLTKEIIHSLNRDLLHLYPVRQTDVDEYMDGFDQMMRLIASMGNFAPKKIRFDPARIEEHIKEVLDKFKYLLSLEMREHVKSQFEAEVGQEIAELVYFVDLFPTLFFGKTPGIPPTPEELGITPQALLAGIAEIPGELKRSMVKCFASQEVPKKDRDAINLRYMKIVDKLYGFLEEYGAEYGGSINNSQRRGYHNTFRGMLGRMASIMASHLERMEEGLE